MNIIGVIIRSWLDTNIVLTPFDHWIKEENHVELYAGYTDDFIMLHKDTQYLWELLYKVENYPRDKLKLNLNQKTGIFPGTGIQSIKTHAKIGV
jgi:hypothetical protein